MNFQHFSMSVLLLTLSCSASLANNTYFLPGDAFFYARLDLDLARKLASSDSPILQYGNHSNSGNGCGHIGYQQIQLTKLSDQTKSAIGESYRQFQDEIKADPNLGGQMSVFIYSDDYDWKKFGLGLQYNEKWVEESVSFGVVRGHVQLESFVQHPNSLMKSWRDATLVAALPTENPKLPDLREPASSSNPVRIDSAKCQILVIPNRDFDSYVNPKNGIELIQITDGTLTRFLRTNGEWQTR